MLRPLSSFPVCRCTFVGLVLVTLAASAGAQSLAPGAPPASAPVGSDYRSGSVPAVGPDVDLSNVGGASPMAPVGVAPPAASDTLGSDTPTPIGRPAPMGGVGPTLRPLTAAPPEAAASAASPAPAPRRHRRKEGSGPDGTPNPGGKGVVIISPQ